MTKEDQYVRTARRALDEADDECRALEGQRARHVRCCQPVVLIDAELRRAREGRKLARTRVRIAERMAA